MDSQSMEAQKSIFRSELLLLKEKEYISEKNFEETMNAHIQFYADLVVKKEELATAKEKPLQQPIPQVKKEKKKRLSAEEIRERNISWSLNLGVILLLIGGLFVATSNWETMDNWMKSGSIAFVSLLFYGIAYVSKRILRIERTSFAFIVLGSLFLPIFILSVGWFELFGPYLSFYGEGRFVLGAMGSFLLIPIYGLLAKNLQSRLFVWFSFICLSAGIGYCLAAFQLERDGFYLGLMAFNALLVAGYHWVKTRESLKLFTKELVYFAQINLVLSTMLMFVFFDSPIFNSLNVLLTAAVYLAMVYVSGKKEYHFVFSVMVVYGAYQLIEHSILESFGPVLYALVGVGFLVVPRVMDGQHPWEKIFRLTSAVVSSLAFIYISFEGILLNMNEPSYALVLAYLIIAVQFTYLANVMQKELFSYLSPVFLASALYEVVLLLDQVVHFDHFIMPVFMIGFMVCLLLGYWQKQPILLIIKKSSRDVGFAIMLFAILISFGIFDWMNVGIMLLLFSYALVITDKVEKRSFYTDSTPWAIPFSIGLAFIAFGEEMRSSFSFYEDNLGMAMNAVLAGAMLLLFSYIWKIKNHVILAKNAFFMAQGFYTIAIFAAITLPINGIWMRPLVLLGGVGMYLALYLYTKFKWVPYTIATVSLAAYYSILYAIHIKGSVPALFSWIQLPFGAFILLAVAYYLLKKDPLLAKGFSWVGHLYLPLALLPTLFIYHEKSFWSFIVAMAIYWISSRLTDEEWRVKLFLYSSFLSLFMVVSTGIDHFYGGEFDDFAYIVTSGIVFVFWLLTNKADKQRTVYFLVPFSLIGILSFIASYPFGWVPFVTMVLYSVGLIAFLHMIRKDIFIGLPLFLLFAGTILFLLMNGMEASNKLLITGGFGLGLTLRGQLLYQKLFDMEEKVKKVDSYTMAALLFFVSMYGFQTEALWTQILPGILISFLFILQRKRIHSEYAWIAIILSGIYLLQPYYTVLRRIDIPDLIETEVYVFPFVAIVIFARYCLKGKFSKVTGLIQWAILVIVSLVLIADSLASSTVYDALILGTLALISMLAGMLFRVKSYFFVGSGVLLLNVLLQTRPYWGNLPWWAYLLIAGSILIAVASYNEWHKQKTAKGEKTIISGIKQNVIKNLKEWE
ncbi:hypothetical protein BGM26_06790 [Bacillus sp. FJAT-29790]|uniref:hypothetical protein n=1 Tax=Bacillus sp. FJAT-29790 TaxID=1895002 RepID=UPI001C23FC8D|nr:hypothetical protein [Bacillus sp. FJAT-29790]MBU8878696.1 hypothetical protein [Bacillus sp. FJAT-29790]